MSKYDYTLITKKEGKMRESTRNFTKYLGGLVVILFVFGLFFSVARAIDDANKKDEKGIITYKDGRVRKKEQNSINFNFPII